MFVLWFSNSVCRLSSLNTAEITKQEMSGIRKRKQAGALARFSTPKIVVWHLKINEMQPYVLRSYFCWFKSGTG